MVKQLPKRKIGASSRECVFCYEKFQNNEIVRILPCKHYFHIGCLKPWLECNTSCPVCRFDVKKYFEDDEC